MTKDEFLNDFLQKAGLSLRYRTPDGVKIGSFQRVAIPCDTGTHEHWHYDGKASFRCSGWLLVEPPRGGAHKRGVYSVTRHS